MNARFHVDHATAQPLLDRLQGVQKQGNGWRAKCPACGGHSRKVSIAETDGKVLVHCFGGCNSAEVIGAVGLTWADLFPPRHWPDSPDERRQQRRAIRESGWGAALEVLSLESTIVAMVARVYAPCGLLTLEDQNRLEEAVKRIDHAASVLCEPKSWRHA